MRRPLALAVVLLALLGACRAPAGSALRRLDDGEAGFTIRITGNAAFDERDLLKVAEEHLREFIDTEYRKFAVDDAAYAIELHYQEQGFPFAEVDYELDDLDPGARVVQVVVAEGPRVEYAGARFEFELDAGNAAGQPAFSEAELGKLVPTKGSGFLGFGPERLVLDRLEAGKGRIESLYYESGFLEVQVELLEVEYDEPPTTGVARYRVVEGPRFTLRSIEVRGLPEEWAAEVQRSVSASVGSAWFPRVAYGLRARAEAICAERGRPDAEAVLTSETDPETGDVHAVLKVDPGPLVRVRQVLVLGNERTSTAFIRNRMRLGPGDPFDQREVDAAFKALYRTGIFEQLRIQLRGDDPESRDLVIEVSEGPAWELYLEPGWGSYEKLRASFGFLDRNIFGTGRQFAGNGSLSVLSQRGTLSLTDTTLLGPDTTTRLEVYGLHRQEPSFVRQEYGTGAQVRHLFTPRLDGIVRYDWVDTDSSNLEGEGAVPGSDEQVDLSLVTFSSSYDARDSQFLPHTGSLSRAAVEVSDEAIGSGLSYFRLLGSHYQYLPLGDVTELVAGFRTGVLLASDDTVFPIQLRFFNGGENTVRSFREQQLGPKDASGQPVGGEAYSVFNVELRRMLVSRFQAALFLDAGNVLLESEDWLGFSDIRTGVGGGLRWLLPIGPVRLDLAANPDPREDEARWILHFSLGTAF